MNWLDIIIVLLLAFAVWDGWRQGAVTQILGLAALGLGVWLGWQHGDVIGHWMGLEGNIALGAGFVTVLVVVVIAVVLIGWLTRGLFRVVGLGVFDNLLGVVLSALKMTLFVGLFIIFIGFCDPHGRLISHRVKEQSALYKVVDAVNGLMIPFVRDVINGDEKR
jgi:membrane protein required for colicin V production